MHGPQAWTTRRIDATGHGGGGASRKPLPPPGDGGGTPSPRVGAACDISPPGLCAFLLILTCIVSPSLSLRSSPRAYKHPMSEIAAAAGGAAADDDAVPARGGVPPPWAKSSAVARSRSTCFSCRSCEVHGWHTARGRQAARVSGEARRSDTCSRAASAVCV
eukprot:366369-Chlamydomonas_euryale.AAC.2